MTSNGYKDILKDLAPGEKVLYIGPSTYIHFKEGIKIKDMSTKMVVRIKNKEYRLNYENLTCREIVLAKIIANEITK